MLAAFVHGNVNALFEAVAIIAVVLALFEFTRGAIEVAVGLLILAVIASVVFVG